ncbi:MAG: 3-deoxy-8-phosphooctulonate synthase [Acidobacteria bacterium RIFCSPLOWO2_12_FULL_60_22]|nr:MAG: 3-deoxy-8-phosphooctulonate synthase [Acidobacteria bacterium RIFCSPLOWO2_12_FULL_60_22]
MAQQHMLSVSDVPLRGGSSFFLIAGPCVIESEEHVLRMARAIQAVTRRLGVPLVFKSSFDKANRTSLHSYRGPGLEKGLQALRRVKEETGLPLLTDVHEVSQVEAVAQVCDVIQIPAFLSRQTDLLLAAGRTGKVVNIKKGQFVSPQEVRHAVEKVRSTGNERIVITERGSAFGYNNLVVDMRSLPILRGFGVPVVLDVTHSVQLPGGAGNASGGQPEFIEPLARAGIGAGLDGIFMEVHDNPAAALSDGPNALPLSQLEPLLERLLALDRVVRPWL